MKKTIIISLVIAVGFFFIGYFIGAKDGTYQAGWDSARKRLSESGYLPNMNNEELIVASGEVRAVIDKAITLKTRPLDPLSDVEPIERIVETDGNTKIYLLEQKDQIEYQKELQEFYQKQQKQIKDSVEKVALPEFFIRKVVGLSDIKVGANISVVAGGQNIKNVSKFLATEITVGIVSQ